MRLASLVFVCTVVVFDPWAGFWLVCAWACWWIAATSIRAAKQIAAQERAGVPTVRKTVGIASRPDASAVDASQLPPAASFARSDPSLRARGPRHFGDCEAREFWLCECHVPQETSLHDCARCGRLVG